MIRNSGIKYLSMELTIKISPLVLCRSSGVKKPYHWTSAICILLVTMVRIELISFSWIPIEEKDTFCCQFTFLVRNRLGMVVPIGVTSLMRFPSARVNQETVVGHLHCGYSKNFLSLETKQIVLSLCTVFNQCANRPALFQLLAYRHRYHIMIEIASRTAYTDDALFSVETPL